MTGGKEEREADAMASASGQISGADTERPAAAREIEPLVDALCARYPEVTLVLFGSRARGSARRYSDYDLGVCSDPPLTLRRYLQIVERKCDLEEDLPFFVDLVDLDRVSDAFLREISEDWIFLHGDRKTWLRLQERAQRERDEPQSEAGASGRRS